MAHSVQSARKCMHQEATDEFTDRQVDDAIVRCLMCVAHGFSVTKGDGFAIEADVAAVADWDPVGVSGQILEQVPGAGEWRFCIDVAFGFPNLVEKRFERFGVFQVSDGTGEHQITAAVGFREFIDQAVCEKPSQHLDQSKEGTAAGFPLTGIDIEGAIGHDCVHVRMKFQCRIPSMQYRGSADSGAKALGVGGDGDEGLGSRFHHDVEDDLAVCIGDLGNRSRHGEHHMEVWHRQHSVELPLEPFVCSTRFASR